MVRPSYDSKDRQSVDPFSAFISMHLGSRGTAASQKRFNSGEHVWLGSCGSALACRRLTEQGICIDASLFEAIPRKDASESLQYGELVALSGDFYESPEALFEERPSVLPWLWENSDVSDLRELFNEELKWIDERLHGLDQESPYPDANIRFAWNAKSYVELALRNIDHFGWHNQLAYARNHAAALTLARTATGPDDERLRRALYTNAFADHFLTDGFAAGHIRVPRAEICDWAAGIGLSERIAGALSKILHDQDGHVGLHSLHAQFEPRGHQGQTDRHGRGLPVMNARGEYWETYCDGQLFLNKSADDPAVMHAVEAVADSVEELLLAWKCRSLPDSIYRASSRVPFPNPGAPSLIEKFPEDMSEANLDRLWNSIAWYVKVPWLSGLKRGHLRALFEALPGLMEAFRAHVAAQRHDPNVAYLDPRYVNAFTRVV